jgi:hypothetical protein
MKLRIKGNSLRLRVSRSEVARLLKRDRLEETIYFAPEAHPQLTYALEQESTVSEPTVRYTENKVTVLIPAEQATTWCLTGQVGIAGKVSLVRLGSLDVLIEKDFACLDRSAEDNQDSFANPNAGAAC